MGWTIKDGATNVIDLSYPVEPGMTLLEVYPPVIIEHTVPMGAEKMSLPPEVNKETGYPVNGYFARTIYQMSEGQGTHVEACAHAYGKLARTIEKYPLSRFIAPAVVIDIESKTLNNPEYNITVDDLSGWEQKNGKIPAGACIVIYSGRCKHFGNANDYFCLNDKGEKRYPGIGAAACKWLVENRSISMVATDCLTVDSSQQSREGARPILPAPSRDILQNPKNDVIIIEYLANVDKLPQSGALIIAAPINFVNGAQGTARIIGVLPK